MNHFGIWAEETADAHGVSDALAVLAEAAQRCQDQDLQRDQATTDALDYLAEQAGGAKAAALFRQALAIPYPATRRRRIQAALQGCTGPPDRGPVTDAPADIPLVMRSRLGELDGCWLELRCRCGRSSCTPIKLMVERHGPSPYIGAILHRLTCRQCAASPTEAYLNERGDSRASGGAKGSWSIPLLLQ